eukprot:gnl/TRDRNA2_/TRDRNA2_185281_c0_seq1.p1 gnl/TRDRNA2_/TRDRNA2_185281_c0~~gnl/TRDRNA2_/TRDRNA2_185281_c0_seq1.p1  ORF type:complete len:181 (-),score=38.62 gnl/TRDRNA2_/TRDRNA2_185281_c0_seq1:82-624(-)
MQSLALFLLIPAACASCQHGTCLADEAVLLQKDVVVKESTNTDGTKSVDAKISLHSMRDQQPTEPEEEVESEDGVPTALQKPKFYDDKARAAHDALPDAERDDLGNYKTQDGVEMFQAVKDAWASKYQGYVKKWEPLLNSTQTSSTTTTGAPTTTTTDKSGSMSGSCSLLALLMASFMAF